MTDATESLMQAGRRLMSTRSAEDSARFAVALRNVADGREISALLAEDEADDIPIADKTAAFEKLLELGPRSAAVLRAFAEHLWLHGPQDDRRVERLRAEADALDAGR